MLNKPHPDLLEPMFHIHTEEIEETIYLERQYLYESQLAIKPSYAAGEKILIWVHRGIRYRNEEQSGEPHRVLLASDLFLLDDPHEFQRFRAFLKTQRILDAQARDWLAHHHEQFGQLAESVEGIEAVLNCLGNIQEWPDPENGFRRRDNIDATFEGVAKNYSDALVRVRRSSLLAEHLLQRAPDCRLRIFRLLSYAEDRSEGPKGLFVFLRDLGAASRNQHLINLTSKVMNGQDLSKAIEGVRQFLVSTGMPG